MTTDIEIKKMRWHSRRGMLELDLLLVPFANNKLQHLEDRLKNLYRQLLTEEDQDLFSWLIQKEVAPDPELNEIIHKILEN
tara:strand:+ start:119 stop:361 length:243 start_codon:yes stop_codon:yes gene_type:complete